MNTHLCLAAALFLASTGGLHAQGSLTPPPGPPEPVMKTLDQVEARRPVNTLPGDANAVHVISVPGSYYFTGPVGGHGSKAGIRIDTFDVTLDLNGYALEAVSGSTKGILVTGSGPVIIRNGYLRFWSENAIHFQNPCQFVLEDLVISSVLQNGIYAQGAGRIERVSVIGAGGIGIYAAGTTSQAAVIRGCRVENVTGPTAKGIVAPRALIEGCAVANISSTAGESIGIQALQGTVSSCIVQKITATEAMAAGVSSARNVVDTTVALISSTLDGAGYDLCENVRGCSVANVEALYAFGLRQSLLVSHTSVTSIGVLPLSAYSFGISNGNAASQVTDCHVSSLKGSNEATGIYSHLGSLVSRNTVSNCSTGIRAFFGEVTLNSVIGSSYAGILDLGSCLISGNKINGNQGIGIWTGNPPSDVRDNHVRGCATGIRAIDPKTIVIRNTAGSNTLNFDIPAGMPIATTAALGTNPNANISQ
jgi:hypothetical protein